MGEFNQIVQHIVAAVVHDSRLNRSRNRCEAFSWSEVQQLSRNQSLIGAGFEAKIELARSVEKEVLF